jgi:hypothetical protein
MKILLSCILCFAGSVDSKETSRSRARAALALSRIKKPPCNCIETGICNCTVCKCDPSFNKIYNLALTRPVHLVIGNAPLFKDVPGYIIRVPKFLKFRDVNVLLYSSNGEVYSVIYNKNPVQEQYQQPSIQYFKPQQQSGTCRS